MIFFQPLTSPTLTAESQGVKRLSLVSERLLTLTEGDTLRISFVGVTSMRFARIDLSVCVAVLVLGAACTGGGGGAAAGTNSGGQDGLGPIGAGGSSTLPNAGAGGADDRFALRYTVLPDVAEVTAQFMDPELLADDLPNPQKVVLAENDAYVALWAETAGLGRVPKRGGALDVLGEERVRDVIVADGSVYWEQSNDIWQAGSASFSDPHTLFTQGTDALAISGQLLFAVPYDTRAISSLIAIDLQAIDAELVKGPLGTAPSLVADAHHVYASYGVQEESDGFIYVYSVVTAWSIPDWTETTLLPSSGAAMATNDDYLYVASATYDAVMRFPASEPEVGQGQLVTRGLTRVKGIGVDDENVYILDGGPLPCGAGGTLWAVPKSGGQHRVLVENLSCPWGLAVDQSGIYWIELPTTPEFEPANDGRYHGRLKVIRKVGSLIPDAGIRDAGTAIPDATISDAATN